MRPVVVRRLLVAVGLFASVSGAEADPPPATEHATLFLSGWVWLRDYPVPADPCGAATAAVAAAKDARRPAESEEPHWRPEGMSGGARALPAATIPKARFTSLRSNESTTIRVVSDDRLCAGHLGGAAIPLAEATIAATSDGGRLVTGNSFASLLAPPAAQFQPLDPSRLFPFPPGTYIGDQVAYSDPAGSFVAWYLQIHVADGDGTSAILLATREELARRVARCYAFDPRAFQLGEASFDYPDVASTDGFLQFTVNVFAKPGQSTAARSVWGRIPMAQARGDSDLDVEFVRSTTAASLRLVQNAGATMYAASHRDAETIEVTAWPDVGARTAKPVTVAPWWSDSCDDWRSECPQPPHSNWLGRLSSSRSGDLTAAWRAGKGAAEEIGFGWTVPRDAQHPHPYARFVVLDRSLSRLRQPELSSPDFAFAYPAAHAAEDGTVALAAFFGGGSHAGFVVGFSRAPSKDEPEGGWEMLPIVEGRFGPKDDDWGDFTVVRRVPGSRDFLAVGWALMTRADGAGVELCVVRFGWK